MGNSVERIINKLLGKRSAHIKVKDSVKVEPKVEPKDKVPYETQYTKGNSTPWEMERYCTGCGAVPSRDEMNGSYCSNCGNYRQFWTIGPKRAHRQIFRGGMWQHQYIYYGSSLMIPDGVSISLLSRDEYTEVKREPYDITPQAREKL